MSIQELIRARRSVRSFDGRPLDEGTKEKLLTCDMENPYGIPVTVKFLSAKGHGLSCPVVTDCDLYVGGRVKDVPKACVAFGFSFERFVLYAQSLGLGTVWLGGTMNRDAYEKAMELACDELMLCASPVGYPAAKMSMRESMMRKVIKADERFAFEELFFDGDFATPLTKEKAGKFATALEMVRLAPSAVNKQPWRVVVAGDTVHFYLVRSKGVGHGEKLDMQMIDMGIALCHFALTAEELGLQMVFTEEDPNITNAVGKYIASYKLK